jgi:hypothetical protein
MSTRLRFLLPVGLITFLFLTACDLNTVAEVRGDPHKFENKEARIAGVVTKSYGVMRYGFYELEDPTGKIFVVSHKHGVPGKGARVQVRGKVRQAFSFSGIDYGTALEESDRKLLR